MKQILYNGYIHTMDETNPLSDAVLIEDGKYIAVSDAQTVFTLAPDAVKTDLKGAAVYPGLTDSHLHILNYAITSRALVLNDVKDRKEVLRLVREKAQTEDAVDGRGFNEDLWEDRRLITRKDLDEVSPDKPVRLTRVCGHMVVANTAAMRSAGIDKNTSAPEGGTIDYENGIFCENAIGLIFADDGDRGVEACMELLYDGMCRAADAGLTAIFTDDFGTGGYSMHTVAEAYRRLERSGRMPVRVVQQCALPDDESWNEFLNAGFRYGQGTDLYRIGPRKLYSDGSLGARTAWLSVPYADAPQKTGVPIYTQNELNRLAVQSHHAGMPFIVHAIGDAGADCVVKAILHARREVTGTEQLKSGIVHCQITTAELLDVIAKEHILVYAQPVFTEYDLHICRDRVGEELEKTSYNWKTLYDTGVCISSGSDCPVEPLDPAKNIYCAVTRKDFEHYPEGGWMPEQRLSVYEAIACHTVKAAESVGYEDRLGKIKAGFLADASVFPKKFESMDADDILNQKPLFTMVNGVIRRCG